MVKQTDEDDSSKYRIEQKLVMIDRALVRVPNLAIHLQTAKERESFSINKEDHLVPILAMEVNKALSGSGIADANASNEEGKDVSSSLEEKVKDGWTEYQEPILLQVIASELDIDVRDIVDFELNLFDSQGAVSFC